MSNVKKIPISELKVGMFLHALPGSWMDHPFWRTKFLIENQKDILRIKESKVSEVWIDIDRSKSELATPLAGEVAEDISEEITDDVDDDNSDAPPSSNSTQTSTGNVAGATRIKPPQAVALEVELERAKKICETATRAVKNMFAEARMGKAISMDVADGIVEEISLSIMRNPEALITTARLKTADDYTYMHSVAVCALMVALARQLKLDDKATREAGLAGLLHDVGKIETPPEILNKPGRLTDAEFAIVKEHPVQGHRLLQTSGHTIDAVLDVCLHHHERIDGTGYPFGLSGDQISLVAKMGCICDVYDAITSDRAYKRAWSPAESIKQMTEWSIKQYDKAIFDAFINCVGIYPTGSLVRLTSGKLGIVVEQSAKSMTAPKVKVFFSSKSRVYIKPEVIDLSLVGSRESAEKIVAHEDAEKWGLKNLRQI